MKIVTENLNDILGFEIDDRIDKILTDFNLLYRNLSVDEKIEYFNHIQKVLYSDNIVKSGEHRITEWDNGWNENLQLFKNTKDINSLIPKYHSKYKIVRWINDIIYTMTDNFDYKIHICFVDAILQHYIKDCQKVVEFGCGPAYHLIRLNKLNPDLKLVGCDWAKSSQEIITEINNTSNIDIKSYNFDFFKPNYDVDLNGAAIYTVAALEQIGDNFKPFVDYIFEKQPNICIHLEPIDELLDDGKHNILNELSIKYFRKRNYLNGFLPYLEDLERNGKIEILKKQRIFSGSYFIEGHSLIVWKIKK